MDYALRAMLDLALNPREGVPARSADIARRARIPEKFLEAIFVDLRKAGLVRSRRGPEGGHGLARPADTITLGQIRAAVDGPLMVIERAGSQRTDPVETGVRELWNEVEASIADILERVTLEGLSRRIQARQGGSDFSI